jgi:heat shock protein HslJ
MGYSPDVETAGESNRHMTHRTRPVFRLALGALSLLLASTVLAACNVVSNGLTGTTWILTSVATTVPAWQGVIAPPDVGRYTIVFKAAGQADIKADCNQVGASYTTTPGGSITITPGPSTLAACPPDSQGQQFVAALSAATSYDVEGSRLTLRQADQSRLEFLGKQP